MEHEHDPSLMATFRLPTPENVDRLNLVAESFGVSRNAFMNAVLDQFLTGFTEEEYAQMRQRQQERKALFDRVLQKSVHHLLHGEDSTVRPPSD